MNRFYLLAAAMLMGIVSLLIPWEKQDQREQPLRIGIAVYDLEDSFMADMTDQLADALEDNPTNSVHVRYEIADARGSEVRQEEQIRYFLEQDCDVLLVNLVKASSAASILNQAKDRQIPVILFNREPNEQDLEIGEDIWYVGADGHKAGMLQGMMLEKAWDARREAIDKNQNGRIDYILIEGEAAHYDTIRRTNAFLQETVDSIPLTQLASLSADWMRQTAYEELAALPEDTIDTAEAIVCGNDDMALGAYAYYKEREKQIPLLLGINSSEEMRALINRGDVYGTVDTNAAAQIETICKLISEIVSGHLDSSQKVWYSTPKRYIGKTAD